MPKKNKNNNTLLKLADGFNNVGFVKTQYLRNTCIPGHSFKDYNSGSRKQCKPIRITVQYNRSTRFSFFLPHYRYYWDIH